VKVPTCATGIFREEVNWDDENLQFMQPNADFAQSSTQMNQPLNVPGPTDRQDISGISSV
jgi:hypothetical protein